MNYKADIGVFGGSGFYSFLENVEEIMINTPYGQPSDKFFIGKYEGKKVAFLPRHGREHNCPPHKIPYKANIYAMKELGVNYIIAPTASGSLKVNVKPGDFVICDQFVDRTCGREDTFFDGNDVQHISPANPYCNYLRNVAIATGKKLNITVHESGTVVVIQGPRFSTKAESKWFANMGWDVINMTQYPECYLAKELGICYANIALITDYDAGLEGNPEVKPVTQEEVYKVFAQNNEKLKTMLFELIKNIDLTKKNCSC